MAEKEQESDIIVNAMAKMAQRKKNEQRKIIIEKGKTFAVFLLYMNQVAGWHIDISSYLAEAYMAHPEELKKIFEYYESVKDKDVSKSMNSIELGAFESNKIWISPEIIFNRIKDKEVHEAK